MSEGHKHREVTVKRGRLVRFLTKPRWHTHDIVRVDASPYPYGQSRCGGYYLSILGVLHRWTGLTLKVK